MSVLVRRWPRLRRFERKEITWLLIGLGACVLLFLFVSLAGEVSDGDTTALDTKILAALRSPSDPSRPIGPPWIENVMFDLTALGGPTVLGLVVAGVIGFLLLQERWHTALVVLIASVGGELVNGVVKEVFMRPRPSVVPHLREVVSPSFPSGHAMESAIIYLTLGAMLMRISQGRVAKVYCLAVAVLLTLLVGVSRVFLGVHYPTDVIGGWMLGFLWASLCWLIEQRFESVTGVKQERNKPAS